MKKQTIKTENKPCAKCKGRVTCTWRMGRIIRVCDRCGHEEVE